MSFKVVFIDDNMRKGLKEPFVLLGFFALLFLVRNKKDLLYKVLLPCGYTLITVFIILLASNSLVGYFSVYLPNMLGNHINTNGTLFDRMKDFRKLLDDLNGFSKYLMVAVVITIYVSAIRGALLFDDEEKIYWKIIFKVIRIILPFIYLYIASLCVGMGGQYFWHHFAFAMPLYYVAMIDSCALIGEGANKINFYPFKKGNGKPTLEEFARPHSLLALMVSAALLFCLGYGIEKHECHMKTEEMKAYVVKAKEHAKYIDSVLDAINKDNYLFIGFNGTDRPYCYTKHMPLGPIFAQDPDNFKEDNFFTRSFLEDLHTADVIVFTSCDSLSIKDEISNYLANNFTNTLPTAAEGIEKPSSFYYQLYFRN